MDGTIKGLFLSRPSVLPAGSTTSKAVPAHSEPAVAVWMGEKKGAPATLALYPLSSLVGTDGGPEKTVNRNMPLTTARKAFYQADKLSMKWNAAGTMVSIQYSFSSISREASLRSMCSRRCKIADVEKALFLTQSDVDKTGKSYYGETNLYLVSLDGSFDGMVDLGSSFIQLLLVF